MEEFQWISIEQVLYIQESTILKHGGSAGMRDKALLESALARPQNYYAYGETDIFQLAAAYAEGIAKNHAFIDGNKRTAYVVAGMFLDLNGFEFQIQSVQTHITLFEELASGIIKREDLAEFYRHNTILKGFQEAR